MTRLLATRTWPILSAVFLLNHVASAQQSCNSATVPDQVTNWSTTVSLPKFDSGLGILNSVQITLASQVRGDAQAESHDNAPATIVLSFQSEVRLLRPDMSILVTTNPLATFTDNVSAYDGTQDYRGTSGVSHLGIIASQSTSVTSPPPASDLVLFSGPAGNPGTITLPISASGTSFASGAGNLIAQFMTSASAVVTVCYNYSFDCNHNGIADAADITSGTSNDADHDGIPDECQPSINIFCVGDGPGNGGADCPCSNNVPTGTQEGCVNELGMGGKLTGTGNPSISNDTLTLHVTQIPRYSQGWFFQGSVTLNGGNGLPFGNGLRCLADEVILQKLFVGGYILPPPGSPPIHVLYGISAGQTKYYQVYYRNVNGSCGGVINSTNGVRVVWGL